MREGVVQDILPSRTVNVEGTNGFVRDIRDTYIRDIDTLISIQGDPYKIIMIN